jgi:hypothetical protein
MDMAVTGLLLRFAPRNDRRKICWLEMVIWARDELNDLGAHENHPHTAIATRPAHASDIRYAVMLASRYHSFVIARSKATKQSSDKPDSGLLCGASHRAARGLSSAAQSRDPLARNDYLKYAA